jgi:hypothetical protein
MLPSAILVLMGTIDCITTVIGVLYFGAVEINPFLSGIVNNIPLFLVVKLSASLCIGGTYLLANAILNQTSDKTTRAFKYSSIGMKVAYAGVVIFLSLVVLNNLSVLLGIS